MLTTRGKTTENHNPEQNTLFLDSTVWISEIYHLSFGKKTSSAKSKD